MTGQLALDLGLIPVVERHHRGVPQITVRRVDGPAPRRAYLWRRGRQRLVRNVDVRLAGVL